MPALLRLALPTVLVLAVQTGVGVAETYFVGFLGTEALAGVSLVFPVLMLMAMMSNGGIGGGVSSAIARALGAGRRRDAEALLVHALVLAVLFGLAFSLGVLWGGPALYAAMGGRDRALEAALEYSRCVFGGAVMIWLVNLMQSALRGAGEVRVPALVILAGAAIVVPLSPLFIFGLGPVPGMGIAGAGVAVLIYYALAVIAMLAYLRSAASPLRLAWAKPEWRLFKEILGVGGLSAVGTVQANLTVAIQTALVGGFGVDAVAGFGMASRLDYILIPLLFALGTATVAMVGANIGAGQVARARRIAWTAAALAVAATEAIGLAAAFFPEAWIGLFSHDPRVLAAGADYLRIVGPFYGFFGLGMALYFASQGAKRVALPVLAGTLRLAVAGIGGWLALRHLGAGLPALYGIAALSFVAFGSVIGLSTWLRSWGAEGVRQ